MATVYLAYDPVLERDVALKLLPNYFAHDPEFFARFEREAKTVAALEHAAIVSMYDYGEDGEWPYFVMRLMTGGDLKGKIERGPLSLEETARIFGRIGAALDKAHSKGMVHRDLKPGNILFDDDGEAYLSDFGIVKIAEAAESYTRTGNTIGTPQYMSPEQLDGLPDVDGRTDIYALGIILYEMLSGIKPYDHESLPRIMVMHLNQPIPNILEANPNLPPEIDTIIRKAMAKERNERYPKASELATAVQAVAAAQNKVATPVVTAVAATGVAATAVEAAPIPVAEPEPEAAVQPEPIIAAVAAETLEPEPMAEPEPPVETALPVSQPEPLKPTTPAPTQEKSGGIPKWVYAVVGVAGLIIIICIGVVLFSGDGNDTNSSEDNIPAGGETEAEEPAAESPETILETFDAQGGWESFSYTDDNGNVIGEASVADGVLHVYTSSTDYICSTDLANLYGEGYYQVDLTAVEVDFSQSQNYFMRLGLDSENLLFYQLDPSGWLWIGYLNSAEGNFYPWLEEGWVSTEELGLPVYSEPGETNTLAIDANGGVMRFYLNGAEVMTVEDVQFTEGDICLGGYVEGDQGFLMAFDNFSFTPAQ